jgi:TonB family protein
MSTSKSSRNVLAMISGSAIFLMASPIIAQPNLAPPPLDTTPPAIAPPFPVYPPPPPAPPIPDGGSNATPTGNPGAWISTNDYPAAALRAEMQGTTTFRVDVSSSGLVTHCSILVSSGSRDLDSATCVNVSRRARFSPARDEHGNAIAGSYTNRVRWVLPEDTGESDWGTLSQHPVSGLSVISFVVGIDGYASECRVVSGPDPTQFMTMELPCASNAVFPVYTDASGKPVPRTVRMTIGVTLPGTRPMPTKKRRR